MDENNLYISIRELRNIRSIIEKSDDDKFRIKGKDYPCNKEASIEMLNNLIDIIRVKNGLLYG